MSAVTLVRPSLLRVGMKGLRLSPRWTIGAEREIWGSDPSEKSIEFVEELSTTTKGYFKRGRKISQDELREIKAAFDLDDKVSALVKELKELIASHKKNKGKFAGGKIAVRVTTSPFRSVTWKKEWERVTFELGKLKGKVVNIAKAEARVTKAYPQKPRTKVELITGE